MDASLPAGAPEEFLQHAERLRALARRLARDDASAEDLLQEAWLEAQRRPRAHVGRIGPWLAGVLRNLAREERRGTSRRARRENAAARSEAQPATVDVVARVEGFRELARELQSLEEPYRTTIVRLYFDGLGAEELASELGVPSATVRSRHKRALDELRRRLDARPGGRAAWVALFSPGAVRRRPSSLIRWLPFVAGAGLIAYGAWWLATALSVESAADPAGVVAATTPRLEVAQLGHDTDDETSRIPSAGAVPKTSTGTPLALVLVDERTRAPLPAFELVVTDGEGRSETLVSDEHGAVLGALRYEPGELALHLIDHPRLREWRERKLADRNLAWIVPWQHVADAGTAPELALDVGPTWELHFAGAVPTDVESITCRILTSTPGAPVPEARAPIRIGPRGAWVRFASDAFAVAGPGPWRIDAESGLAGARTEIDSLMERAALHFEFTQRSALTVRFVDAAGAVVPGRVELVAHSGEKRTVPASADGAWQFTGLEPGAWTASGRELMHVDVHADVELEPGRPRELALATVRKPVAGKIAGVVRIQGRAIPLALIELAPRGAPELARKLELGDGTELRSVFAFDMPGLPDAEYVLRAAAPGIHRWRPGLVVVRPGCDDVELVADAAAPARELVLRAFDAETGAPIAHFQARVDVDPDATDARPGPVRATRKSSILFAGIPLDAKLAWTIAAEGYSTLEGDERALEEEGDHSVVRAKLTRGFARRLRVLDAHGAPLARIPVRAAGVDLGATDARGELWIVLSTAPRRLTLERDGRAIDRDVRELESEGLATWIFRYGVR